VLKRTEEKHGWTRAPLLYVSGGFQRFSKKALAISGCKHDVKKKELPERNHFMNFNEFRISLNFRNQFENDHLEVQDT